MKKNFNIFQEDIKVPEIVLQKADEAFARIQTEGRSAMQKIIRQRKRNVVFGRTRQQSQRVHVLLLPEV